MNAKRKLDALWTKLRMDATSVEPRPYPEVQELIAFGKDFDYGPLLDYCGDLQPITREKVVCATGGAIALVSFEWLPHVQSHFTGMFRCAEYGLLRACSVIEPQRPPRWTHLPALVPMVGLKFFRDGDAPSASLVLAHRKQGQKENNFLLHAMCNHTSENATAHFKSVLNWFKRYSDFPTFTGLADFACIGQDGHREDNPLAPYALVLMPTKTLRQRSVNVTPDLIDQFTALAPGDVLYDAYVVPEPIKTGRNVSDGAVPSVWLAGRLKVMAPFMASALADKRLFFQHHRFEEDLELRPDWRKKADTMLGSPFYQELVEVGDVWDPDADRDVKKCKGLAMRARQTALKHEELDTKDQARLGPLLEIMGLHHDVEELEISSGFSSGFYKRRSLSAGSDLTKSLGSSFFMPTPRGSGDGDSRSCPFLGACCSNAHAPEEDFRKGPAPLKSYATAV
jgi:hypothetical protein